MRFTAGRTLLGAAAALPLAAEAQVGAHIYQNRRKDSFDDVLGGDAAAASAKAAKDKGMKCPKPDGLSAFESIAFVDGSIFVRIGEEVRDRREPIDDEENVFRRGDNPLQSNGTESCLQLETLGGVSAATLLDDASKQCGPVGEYKRRFAEELSVVLWSGGSKDWPGLEGQVEQVVEVKIKGEDTPRFAVVSAHKQEKIAECWHGGCGCEQSESPRVRYFFTALLGIGILGIARDFILSLSMKKPKRTAEEKAARKARKAAKAAKRAAKEGAAAANGGDNLGAGGKGAESDESDAE